MDQSAHDRRTTDPKTSAAGAAPRPSPGASTKTSTGASVQAPYVTPWHVEEAARCYFYHTLDLPGLGVVDGGWDLRGRFADYIGHADLAGARVLDVGAASGFLSFSAEAAGAREVVSFDLDTAARQDLLPFAGSQFVTDHANWVVMMDGIFEGWKNGYWLAHRLLGSRVRVCYGDVYKLPDGLGRFDAVIVGAILEHLVDPLSALRSLADATDDLLIINTDYFDTPAPVARFLGSPDRPEQSFTFWQWSIALYDATMAILGFSKVTEMRNGFAGTRPAPGEPRPDMPRVALVYRRRR